MINTDKIDSQPNERRFVIYNRDEYENFILTKEKSTEKLRKSVSADQTLQEVDFWSIVPQMSNVRDTCLA